MAIKTGVLDRTEVLRQIEEILSTPDLREVHIELKADRYSVPTLIWTATRDVAPRADDEH